MTDDDLLSPSELAELMAPMRIITSTRTHSWDAMSAEQWALKMQGRSRPVTDAGAGEKSRRGSGNRDFILVSTIGDISQSLSSGAARQQRVRNKRRRRKEPSPLDPVARPLLIEARAYSVSLRAS